MKIISAFDVDDDTPMDASDQEKEIPAPEVLAEEVSLLMHVEEGENAVAVAKMRLLPEVAVVLG